MARSNQRVGILLPLSGANAPLGNAMLMAARLAADTEGAPSVYAYDTRGQEAGAAMAARQAIDAGVKLILGPLTSIETAAAGPVAMQHGIVMLAFTSDSKQARPGLWTLGITPSQQLEPLAAAVRSAGHARIAGLLPDTDYGRALANALNQSTAAQGLATPRIQMYSDSFAAVNSAARTLSDYATRRGPIDEAIRAARVRGDAEGKKLAAYLARQTIPHAPFDALLLAESGDKLAEVLSLLPYYDIDSPNIQLLGPALWSSMTLPRAVKLGLAGAWFAAPDPSLRVIFEQAYLRKYGSMPPPLADVAYDATAIAVAATRAGAITVSRLVRSDGFPGVDGLLMLKSNGAVERNLAVFQFGPGGGTSIKPTSASPGAPGT